MAWIRGNDGTSQPGGPFRESIGTDLITGVQALVRLMLLQAERDAAAGIKSGGYVSGYRGSPLCRLDTAFASIAQSVAEHGIVVQPAVNEELAATAIAGTQQFDQTPPALPRWCWKFVAMAM